MARRKLEAQTTPFPTNTPISKPIPKLDETQLEQLGQACRIIFEVSMGNSRSLDYNLDIWNAILEMRAHRGNLPWEGAAHQTTPTVFSAYQEFCSRTIGSVLQPRPYTVRGNDPVASQYAHLAEQFYNAEWDKNDCFDAYEEAILFSARDATCIMEVLYELSSHQETFMGTNPMTGKVEKQIVEMVDWDAPRERPVDLKSFKWYPLQAKSINEADAVFRKLWMNEKLMNKMVGSKLFFKDAVEEVLAFVSTGQGEQSYDPQGNSQWTISNMITITDTAIAPPEGIAMGRGPCQIERMHTDLFDLDGDGIFEENVIWFHYRSGKVLGFAPFDYFGGRPFFDCTPIRRPGLFIGFSIPEIGRSIQEEVDVQTNARLNLLDLAIKPTRYKTDNAKYRDPEKRFGPDVEILVQRKDDAGYLETPRVPPESFEEQQVQEQRLDRAVGAPQAGALQPATGGSQQRSARAASIEAQLKSMQSNLVITRLRRFMLKVFKYKTGLYLRYGKDQLETIRETQQGTQRMTVPKEILGLDYTYGIAGLGGALDKDQRRQDLTMFVQALMEFFPSLIQGNLQRQWQLARLLSETFDIPDVTPYIGTFEEAGQLQQQQAQNAMANAQMQALMQVLSHQNKNEQKPQQKNVTPQQQQPQQANPLAALMGGQ